MLIDALPIMASVVVSEDTFWGHHRQSDYRVVGCKTKLDLTEMR